MQIFKLYTSLLKHHFKPPLIFFTEKNEEGVFYEVELKTDSFALHRIKNKKYPEIEVKNTLLFFNFNDIVNVNNHLIISLAKNEEKNKITEKEKEKINKKNSGYLIDFFYDREIYDNIYFLVFLEEFILNSSFIDSAYLDLETLSDESLNNVKTTLDTLKSKLIDALNQNYITKFIFRRISLYCYFYYLNNHKSNSDKYFSELLAYKKVILSDKYLEEMPTTWMRYNKITWLPKVDQELINLTRFEEQCH